ncbi:hypothetical protein GJAV_G00216190 [Gymnothorax javanicus]|nr:hypothetical protein GJAV_G00216190 [Gymnothorax javanicus]
MDSAPQTELPEELLWPRLSLNPSSVQSSSMAQAFSRTVLNNRGKKMAMVRSSGIILG